MPHSCHEDVGAEGLKQGCPSCMAWHHAACWREVGDRCASCGFQPDDAGPAPEPTPRPDPKSGLDAAGADPEWTARLPEWPEGELQAALTSSATEYDAPALAAIRAELGRRGAAAEAAPEPPPSEDPSPAPGEADPEWVAKLEAWPIEQLHDALEIYGDEYTPAQRRAIYAEIRRRGPAALHVRRPAEASPPGSVGNYLSEAVTYLLFLTLALAASLGVESGLGRFVIGGAIAVLALLLVRALLNAKSRADPS